MIKKFGLYLTQNRYHAMWVVLVCALLPLVGIPANVLATIIVGLVTLHRGAKEGFLLLCWASLPGIVLFFLGDAWLLMVESLGKDILVWLLACWLGRTASWSTTVQLGALLGVLLVVMIHLIVPDMSSWWLAQLTPRWGAFQQWFPLGVTPEQSKEWLDSIAQWATGAFIGGMLLFDTMILLLARAWQATLFNPGGLSKEWRQLQMSYVACGVLVAAVVGALLRIPLFLDVLPVIGVAFILAGLSVIHARLPEKKQIRVPILIVLYLALLILQYLSMLLVLLGFVDSWYDFRKLRKKAAAG